ncbi:MAG TPA: amidohydrolase family protein [Microvirga sp.]|jgi:D-galactarolactone isomerase|nr:amidohydrolase family protein [Microvirga sp.]
MTAASPELQAPPQACDTHIHVYDPRYPLAPTAAGPAPERAGFAEYRAVQRRLGLERAVIVQPTAYGFDNRATLEGIAMLGPERTRGIAVVDDDVADDAMQALHAGGIRGVRFQMLPGGALPWERADRVAARAREAGWHVQLQLDGRTLPDRLPQIRSWAGPIVIDHVGKFLEPVPLDHPGFRCLADLVATGRVWVKLSAPYEVSKTGAPAYEDVGRIARELVRLAPERMLWASNWPHPGAKSRPDEAALLDLLLDWAPDEAVRRRILVDNPAEVYGF